jgi:hypothetical protein
MQTIKAKEKELDDLFQNEEIWWRQRSRAMWLKHGDKHTAYSHQKANQRRRKNRIECLEDEQGVQQFEPSKIEDILLNHFKQLFESQDTYHISDTVDVVRGRIIQDMFNMLSEKYTSDEVLQAIEDMKALAAPGPDGLPAFFYQTY